MFITDLMPVVLVGVVGVVVVVIAPHYSSCSVHGVEGKMVLGRGR